MKKLSIIIVLLVVGFVVFKQVNAPSSEFGSSDIILIGGITPLTGDTASIGIPIRNAANLHVEEINTAGGVNGKMLEIIWEDGKCTPGDSSRSAQKLINIDKVPVIMSMCSGETLGAAPITEKNKVILLSPTSSSPEVTKAGDFVFRTAPSDSSQGKVLAEYANAHFTKVGLITEQTDYAMGIADTFEKNFTGTLFREDYLSTESDFKTRIAKLKNENVDALFINAQNPLKYGIIVKQLQEQNWSTPLLANEVVAGDPESSRKHKDFLVANTLIAGNFIAPENPRLIAFGEKYKARFGVDPPYLNYMATTNDALDILVSIWKDTDPYDTEAVRDKLYAVKDFNGMYEHFAFDENGDSNITHSLFKFDGENFVLLKE